MWLYPDCNVKMIFRTDNNVPHKLFQPCIVLIRLHKYHEYFWPFHSVSDRSMTVSEHFNMGIKRLKTLWNGKNVNGTRANGQGRWTVGNLHAEHYQRSNMSLLRYVQERWTPRNVEPERSNPFGTKGTVAFKFQNWKIDGKFSFNKNFHRSSEKFIK